MIIKYSKESLKFLSKLDKASVTRIRNAICGLTENPPRGDIKLMKGFAVSDHGELSSDTI